MKALQTKTRCGPTSWTLWACALLFVLPQSGWAQSGDDILRTSERLLTEERRQLDVRRRISVVVRRIGYVADTYTFPPISLTTTVGNGDGGGPETTLPFLSNTAA